MNKQELNNNIQDKVFFFTEQLNNLMAKEDNTYMQKKSKGEWIS